MSTITRYRILERSSPPGEWSAVGLAFTRDHAVFLWLPAWRAPLRLNVDRLDDLDTSHFPSLTTEWRWADLPPRTSEAEPFRPIEALRSARSVPASKVRRVAYFGHPIPPRDLAGAAVLHRGVPGLDVPSSEQAESPGYETAYAHALLGEHPYVAEPAAGISPPGAAPVQPASRVPILIHICAPVLGASGDAPLVHLPIDGWREWRRVRDEIEKAKHGDSGRGVPLKLVRLRPPTLASLKKALQAGQHRPVFPMVGIVGYARGQKNEERLYMEQHNGREDPVRPEELADAFKHSGVQIVLLNICYGLTFAEALRGAGVSAVITTRGLISDPEATCLARQVYLRLAYGDTVREAFLRAKECIMDAYRSGELPPLRDRLGESLHRYGIKRAANIVLLPDDSQVRLPLPPPGQAATEPAYDLSEPPNNLPIPDDVFVGRGRELVTISDMMEERKYRVIVLCGIGGIGKSTLALRAAHRNRWRFSCVIYMTAKDSEGRRRRLTLTDVCRRVEAVLGLGNTLSSLPTLATKSQRLAEVLNAHPTLLLLDNVEVLSPRENQLLAEFLQFLDPQSGTMVMLTLRPEDHPPLINRLQGNSYSLTVESLDLVDAVALLGELLKLPVHRDPTAEERQVWAKVPAEELPPGGIAQAAQFQLLAKRADVPEDRVTSLEALARAAYQHPLLLQFAAADLRRAGNRWDAVLHRLGCLRGKELQDRVQEMIGQMCDDLAERAPNAFQLLQTLLVFSGGATPEALRFVWWRRHVDPASEESEVFDEARRVAWHAALLDFKAERFDLHPLVRQFLLNRFPPEPALQQQWSAAFAVCFRDYAERNQRNYDALDGERLNIFAALDWAESAADHRMVVDIVLHLADFQWARGYWSEGLERLRRGIIAAQRLADPSAEAQLQYHAGVMCRYLSAYEEGLQHIEACLQLELCVDDKVLRASALLESGIIVSYQGDHAQCRRYYDQSLMLQKDYPNLTLRARTFHEFLVVCGVEGEYAEAEHYGRQALALEEQIGDKALQAATLHQLAVQNWKQNKYREAEQDLAKALSLTREIENPILKARIICEYGVLCSLRGEQDKARRHLEDSLQIRRQLGDRTGQARALFHLGELELNERNPEVAEDLFRRSLELADQVPNPYWRAYSLYGLGICAVIREDRAAARKFFEEALSLAERLNIPLVRKVQPELERL